LTADKDAGLDWEATDALYGQVFREAGLDVETLSAEEGGKRLHRTTVAAELAAMVEHWAQIRRPVKGADDPLREHLLRVARAADLDLWRTRVRDALEREDRPALLQLAASEKVFDLPAATLALLGSGLGEYKETRSQAEVFLREAQRRHPNDFSLNLTLQ